MTESYRRHFEVRMIHNIEEFSSELHIETLRNSLDRLILENGKIQIRRSRSVQEIARGIASKIETCQRRQPSWRRVAGISSDRVTRIKGVETVPEAWWRRIAVGVPKSQVGSGRNGKALGLDVVSRISRIDETRAIRGVQSIRKRPVVTVKETLRIATRCPSSGKRNTIAHLKDRAKLPSIRDPCGRS